jgi:hypothetical protein
MNCDSLALLAAICKSKGNGHPVTGVITEEGDAESVN